MGEPLFELRSLYQSLLERSPAAFYPILLAATVIIFFLIYSVADGHLCPALEALADNLHLSPEIAGITLVALGNGAPDLLVAIFGASASPQLVIGAVTGATLFLLGVVLPAVILCSLSHLKTKKQDPEDHSPPSSKNNLDLERDSGLRELILMFVADVTIGGLLLYGKFPLWIAVLMILAYLVHMCLSIRAIDLKSIVKHEYVPEKRSYPWYSWPTGFLFGISTLPSSHNSHKEIHENGIRPRLCHRACQWRFVTAPLVVSFILCAFLLDRVGWFPWMSLPMLLVGAILDFARLALFGQLLTSIFNLASCLVWVALLSSWLMDGLQVALKGTPIPPALLSFVLVAWGNSAGDLVADLTLARRGHGVMALAAALASPTQNCLLTTGLAFLVASAKRHGASIELGRVENGMFFSFALVLFMIAALMGAFLVSGFRAQKWMAWFMLAIYIGYITSLGFISAFNHHHS